MIGNVCNFRDNSVNIYYSTPAPILSESWLGSSSLLKVA